MNFAQKLGLTIQSSQEEREKQILNAKHNKLSIDGVQIPHPNNIKDNWITGSEYLPSIVLKNIDECRIEFSKESFKGREKLIIFWPCNAS